jgi:hypothetical protein
MQPPKHAVCCKNQSANQDRPTGGLANATLDSQKHKHHHDTGITLRASDSIIISNQDVANKCGVHKYEGKKTFSGIATDEHAPSSSPFQSIHQDVRVYRYRHTYISKDPGQSRTKTDRQGKRQ